MLGVQIVGERSQVGALSSGELRHRLLPSRRGAAVPVGFGSEAGLSDSRDRATKLVGEFGMRYGAEETIGRSLEIHLSVVTLTRCPSAPKFTCGADGLQAFGFSTGEKQRMIDPSAHFAGDEDFLYYRIDILIDDVLMFAPKHCNTEQLRTALQEWFDNWDGQPVESLRFITDMVEDHTWVPRERSRYIPTRVRRAVMMRDGFACTACGSTDHLAIDHKKPFVRGGSHKERNLQVLCRSCNSRKSAKTMEEWGYRAH